MIKFDLPNTMNTVELIEAYSKDLLYVSETDSYWAIFAPKLTLRVSANIDCKVMADLTGLGEDVKCDNTTDFDSYMQHLIYSQGVSQGAEVGKRYIYLYECMSDILDCHQVFKFEVSPRRFRRYVIGIDYRGDLVGIFADAVET